MNKKWFALTIGTILLMSLLVGFVSADITSDVNGLIDGVVNVISPLSEKLLGTANTGELLFAKVLFLVIIFSIVWVSINRIGFFQDYTWVLWLVSLSVSIIATRWIVSATLIQTIILPYTALGVALTAGLPFIIYFFVVETGLAGTQYKTVRRVAWIFFGIIFIGLWIARKDAIGQAGYVYLITAIGALIMMTMDGTIQGFLRKMRDEKANAMGKGTHLADVDRRISNIDMLFASQGDAYRGVYAGQGRTGIPAYNADIKHLQKIRTALLKTV